MHLAFEQEMRDNRWLENSININLKIEEKYT